MVRVLQYEFEAAIRHREETKLFRPHRVVVAPLTPAPPKGLGKRCMIEPGPSPEATRPMSMKGEVWSRRHKVRDESGALRSRYRCAATAEYGSMSSVRKFPAPQSRTHSHGNIVFPHDRSIAHEIAHGFTDVAANGPWERKILAAQGRHPPQISQRAFFNQARALTKAAG